MVREESLSTVPEGAEVADVVRRYKIDPSLRL